MRFTEEQVVKLGETLIEELKKYLNNKKTDLTERVYMRDDILQLLFEYITKNYSEYLRYLDLSDISLDNMDVTNKDFSYTNININPQKVKDKDLSGINLEGILMYDKNFDGVLIENANLNDTKALIDVSLLKNCSIRGTKLRGCTIYNFNENIQMDKNTDINESDVIFEETYSNVEDYIKTIFR